MAKEQDVYKPLGDLERKLRHHASDLLMVSHMIRCSLNETRLMHANEYWFQQLEMAGAMIDKMISRDHSKPDFRAHAAVDSTTEAPPDVQG